MPEVTDANLYCLIMAGGVGRRFWPLSRPEMPKQFLKFFGDRSLLQMTVDRMEGLVPPDRCLIVTNERYLDQTAAQLPEVPRENILLEPIGRNTAPCIAFGATLLHGIRPDAVMVVLPADHLIQDVPSFHGVLETAVEAARAPDTLVTIGIRPTRAATGYGYIEFDAAASDSGDIHQVRSFTEKPDSQRADEFVTSERYLWNSGMFAWRADTILHEMEQNIPAVFSSFEPLLTNSNPSRQVISEAFHSSPNISVDYGVMETAGQVYVVPGEFGWSDVGDWQAAYEMSPKDADGNAVLGEVSLSGARDCLVHASDQRIELRGTDNLVVIDAGDTILICDRSQSQRVKEVANLAEDPE
jgi:mannose-1-phosphate guanylyltransferase